MRIAACLLVLCSAVAPGLAQEAIEWSFERRLRTEDFKGKVPANRQSASMSWIHINTSWECETGALVATAHATFDPGRSWFLRSKRSMLLDIQLLEHEQLHFDIAETVVRRIRTRFRDFKDACTEADGTEAIRQMVIDADDELQEEQERYDRETRHGIDARVQDRWKRRIRALLN